MRRWWWSSKWCFTTKKYFFYYLLAPFGFMTSHGRLQALFGAFRCWSITLSSHHQDVCSSYYTHHVHSAFSVSPSITKAQNSHDGFSFLLSLKFNFRLKRKARTRQLMMIKSWQSWIFKRSLRALLCIASRIEAHRFSVFRIKKWLRMKTVKRRNNFEWQMKERRNKINLSTCVVFACTMRWAMFDM